MIDRETAREHLGGPVTSVRTPFRADGEVDEAGLREFVEHCVANGSKAVILTAGDSHFHCLSDAEIAEVTRVTIDQTAGRAMVVAANRFHATARAVEFACFAREAGADVQMCMPPDWAKSCTPASLAEYYAAAARTLPVVIVTNVFIPRGEAFGLEAIRLALDASNGIVAVKDDMGGAFAQQLCLLARGRCATFAGGLKQNHLNMIPFGCDGYMSTYLPFEPEITRRYWSAVQAGDLDVAWEIARKYDADYYAFISRFPGGWNAAMHGTLELFGIAGRWRRKPYYSLDDAEMERLAGFFEGVGIALPGKPQSV